MIRTSLDPTTVYVTPNRKLDFGCFKVQTLAQFIWNAKVIITYFQCCNSYFKDADFSVALAYIVQYTKISKSPDFAGNEPSFSLNYSLCFEWKQK